MVNSLLKNILPSLVMLSMLAPLSRIDHTGKDTGEWDVPFHGCYTSHSSGLVT